MKPLQRADLWSLEEYAERRPEFREQVMAHKRNRRLALGPNMMLLFEDRLTMQYQVQEMLRAERIFEAAGIQEELDAYNALIPDGRNWKATLQIEYPAVAERQTALQRMIGVEDHVWACFDGTTRVVAIADEDMDRERGDEKTSAVHFLRFEFPEDAVSAAKAGAKLAVGVDHDAYRAVVDAVPEPVRAALVADFD
jgi:hypothetical protein